MAKKLTTAAAPTPEPAAPTQKPRASLTFTVSANLRRDFRAAAAQNDMQLNELFEVAFRAWQGGQRAPR